MAKHRLPVLAVALASLSAGAAGQTLPVPMPVPMPGPMPVAIRPLPQPRPAGPVGAPLPAATPGLECRRAIGAAERAYAIPRQLMAAIAHVESGRRNADGSVDPWPWSINAEGDSHIFESKPQAVAAVLALQQRGVRSIDVGCMQVNLLHHPDAFASLDEAFDPAANARYAARFLMQLRDQTGTWPTATAWYHSAAPDIGAAYARQVMAVWPDEQRLGAPPLPRALPSPFALPAIAVATRPVAVQERTAEPTAGRSLANYRAAPIPLAARPLPPPRRWPSGPG